MRINHRCNNISIIARQEIMSPIKLVMRHQRWPIAKTSIRFSYETGSNNRKLYRNLLLLLRASDWARYGPIIFIHSPHTPVPYLLLLPMSLLGLPVKEMVITQLRIACAKRTASKTGAHGSLEARRERRRTKKVVGIFTSSSSARPRRDTLGVQRSACAVGSMQCKMCVRVRVRVRRD